MCRLDVGVWAMVSVIWRASVSEEWGPRSRDMLQQTAQPTADWQSRHCWQRAWPSFWSPAAGDEVLRAKKGTLVALPAAGIGPLPVGADWSLEMEFWGWADPPFSVIPHS